MAVKIYTHPDPSRTLVPLLQRHLPHSGPLLRVIQSFGSFPRSAEACVLATFPPDTEASIYGSNPRPGPESPWMAAYVDIFRHPETQMWMYSSLEATGLTTTAGNEIKTTLRADEEMLKVTRAQLRSLLTYVRTELVSSFISSVAAREKNGIIKTNGVEKLPATPSTGLLMGSVHDGLFELFNGLGPRDDDPTGQKDLIHINRVYPCMKYMFDRSSYELENKPPIGYRFHDRNGRGGIQDHQLQFVLSRTAIQRTKASFAGSAALYRDGHEGAGAETPNNPSPEGEKVNNAEEMPIGWAFLAYDGSIILLHVEPEDRGRGLAPLLLKEIMRRGMGCDALHALQPEDDIDGKEKGWMFADVSTDNVPSQRVMVKAGGKTGWAMRWVAGEVCSGECSTCAGLVGEQN
ncbi:uncharacterized protein GIQ15_01861 [Arthroderma uncinatum]|uniref:uncharacterized protein n=1 Tax=Arthroderma uncinatum TaxID=74035 RepID=UPI00144A6293|nr:uncharacterized protein GIQ15_01861 [Arthroderma uncinatum]KAF3492344.1 hypothetical protein GIQ15_01861 [Arthroderma uncinatum]